MIDAIDSYEAGELDLRTLAEHLKGLLGASDLQDQRLVNVFWNHFAEIEMELELRVETWAPPGSARDARLTEALHRYRAGRKTCWPQRMTVEHERVLGITRSTGHSPLWPNIGGRRDHVQR
jgi:hypothetical protein